MEGNKNRTSLFVALLVGGLLAAVQWHVSPPMLLAERYLPHSGWVEVVLLAAYAAWLYRKMVSPAGHPVFRRVAWRLFSAAFFGQLLLGLMGATRCLMTGQLHLPIPSLIALGPLYRGGGYFMLLLFLMTVALVGPAWCSHLCYVGSWDDAFATRKRRPSTLPPWLPLARGAWALTMLAGALGLGRMDLPPSLAMGLAAATGLLGVALMGLVSRRLGLMFHCTFFCPIHLLATLLGRLNPFRLRIRSGCNQCGLCSLRCRYDALSKSHLQRRRVGLSCTLCGDCLPTCRDGHLAYYFPGLSPSRSRELFLVLVVVLHAVFLGLARI
jgi:ferredoxin